MSAQNGHVTENSETEWDSLYALNEYQQTHLKSRLDSILKEGDPSSKVSAKAVIHEYLKSLPNEPSLKNLPKVQFDREWKWFNVKSQVSSGHLIGRVTVIDFFTYCCINCMHILPELESLEETFPDLLVIGMHSAKFDNEKVSANIIQAVKRYGIRHFVANDWQASLWNKFIITCWPTLMVTGPDGKPLATFIGEAQIKHVRPFLRACFEFFGPNLNPVEKLPTFAFGESSRSASDNAERPPEGQHLLSYPGKVHLFNGVVFVSDTSNHRIAMIDSTTFEIKGFIGQKGKRGFADSTTFNGARFNTPQGLAGVCLEDGSCLLYVCDTGNHALRVCDLQTGSVHTAVGTGSQGSDLSGGRSGPYQEMASPWDVCLGHAPSPTKEKVLFVAMAGTHQIWAYALEENVKFWKMSESMTVGSCVAIAGTGKEENRNTSYPMKASFAQPSGLAFDAESGTLFIADAESSSIRKLCSDGSVKNVVGGAIDPCDLFGFGDSDGSGTAARLQHPLGVAFINSSDAGPSLAIADSYNHKLKIVTDLDKKKAKVTTTAAPGLNEPGGLCYDGSSNSVLIANTNSHSICRVMLNDPEAATTTVLVGGQTNSPDVAGSSVSNSATPSPLVNMRSGRLEVELNLPHNKEINTDAPNRFKFIIPGVEDISGTITDNKFTIDNLSCSNSEGSLTAILDLRLFLCDKVSGTCSVLTKNIKICHKNDDNLSATFSIDF